jgi:hypothetical protein
MRHLRRMAVFALINDAQRLPAHRLPVGCDEHAKGDEVAIAPISRTHSLERLVASRAQPHTLTSRKAFRAASPERRPPRGHSACDPA